MNCPFCGSQLAKVSAICPGCKIQLPEQNLFAYYEAALSRDKTLALAENRGKLDAQVKKEADARAKLLAEARERAKIEAAEREAEREQREKEYRERVAIAQKEAQVKRDEFFAQNSKKIKIGGVLAAVLIAAAVGTFIVLQPDPPKAFDVNVGKVEPCTALGTAAKEVNLLLNQTLEQNTDGGLSESEIRKLWSKAQDIQLKLLGDTVGQTQDVPKLEDAIIPLANALSVYGDSIRGLKSEAELISKGTDPIHQLAKSSLTACESAGFAKQFLDASGWEK